MTTIEQLFGARTALVVPDAIGVAAAAELRARFVYTRYALLDRGSYEYADVDEPAVFALLTRIAGSKTGRSLAVVESRVVRLRTGDYLLARHDRVYDGHPIELMLDLSVSSVPNAEVHYRRRGHAFFRFPCTPGAVSIVERGPTVTCNHTYVSKLHADASIVRLVVLMR